MEAQVALVTGSTSGIGLGIARALAEKGCTVVMTGSRDIQAAQPVLQEFKNYPGTVNYVQADLGDSEKVGDLCSRVDQMHPQGVDILVNNAGTNHICQVESYPVNKWDELMALNLTAPFLLMKHFIPQMKKKGWGRIINMSSQMGVISGVGKAPYSATKAGLIGLTKGVALETAAHGVTCNAICPGYVDTPLLMGQVEKLSKEKGLSVEEAKVQFIANQHPTKKAVDVSQLGELVLFLCSPGGDNMTGTSLMVDGGYTIQ